MVKVTVFALLLLGTLYTLGITPRVLEEKWDSARQEKATLQGYTDRTGDWGAS